MSNPTAGLGCFPGLILQTPSPLQRYSLPSKTRLVTFALHNKRTAPRTLRRKAMLFDRRDLDQLLFHTLDKHVCKSALKRNRALHEHKDFTKRRRRRR